MGGTGGKNGCNVIYTSQDGKNSNIESEVVLVATGRHAYTEGL